MGKGPGGCLAKRMPQGLILLPLLLLASSPPVTSTAATAGPQVIQSTPQGTAKKVRQATARFSEPMVPPGDPRLADPFEIEGPEAGAGRRVDRSNRAYDFVRDLRAGVQCNFRIVSGLTSLAGKGTAGQQVFTFSTGGPAIISSTPHEGDQSIEEEQAFLLTLDVEPTEASLLKHVAFYVEGFPEWIGARLVTGKARQDIPTARFQGRPVHQPVVILQATQRFPNGASVALIWGTGIASRSGVPTDQDQILPFKTCGPFTAQFSCERESRQAGCIPITPMTVQFSAPVAWEYARQVLLVGPGGRRWTPEEEKGKPDFVSGAVFAGPFPEPSSFRVQIPTGLTDDAGRPLANASQSPLAVRTDPFPPLAKFSARFGIATVPAEERPTTLWIQHLGSDQKYNLPLRWDGSGIAQNSWQIPKEAKLGTYQVVMLGGRREGWPALWRHLRPIQGRGVSHPPDEGHHPAAGRCPGGRLGDPGGPVGAISRRRGLEPPADDPRRETPG